MFKALPLDADDLGGYHCVVDLVYSRTDTPLVRPRVSPIDPGCRRPRNPRRPGRAQLRAIHRSPGAGRCDARRGPLEMSRDRHICGPSREDGSASRQSDGSRCGDYPAEPPWRLGPIPDRRARRVRLRDRERVAARDRGGALAGRPARACSPRGARDHGRAALARDRRALRARPHRPRRLQRRHGGGEPPERGAGQALLRGAGRLCRRADAAASRWPTRRTCSRSTTSRC